MASAPKPEPNLLFQPRPCSSIKAPSGSGPISDGSPAPCVLPNVWPPAMSATVSSSFIAMRALRIHVDQTHLHRTERLMKLAFAAIAFVAQPRPFGAPVKLFGFPNIGAPAAKTERLEVHRFQRDVTGQNHQVSPRDFAAVFLLDRPEQPARLVEVRIVRPRVKRCEALLASAGATAAVGDAIRAPEAPMQAQKVVRALPELGPLIVTPAFSWINELTTVHSGGFTP